jgi:hypothetical protein
MRFKIKSIIHLTKLTIILQFGFVSVFAQNLDSLVTNDLGLGVAVPHFNFRDKASSSLAYKGTGLAELSINKLKINESNYIKQFAFDFGYGSAKPAIKNISDWTKSASIFYFDLHYGYLKKLKQFKENKIAVYAGAKLSSNGQFIVYPVINNVRAYNFNWLSLQASSAIAYNFNVRKTKTKLWYQLSIPVFSLNKRPTSFDGTIPVEAVWSQEGSASEAYFKHPKATSLHNNLVIQSTFWWDLPLKHKKIRVSYSWLYQRNTSVLNPLASVKSALGVTYLMHRKKHKK